MKQIKVGMRVKLKESRRIQFSPGTPIRKHIDNYPVLVTTVDNLIGYWEYDNVEYSILKHQWDEYKHKPIVIIKE